MKPESIATVSADPNPAADAGRGQQDSTPSEVSSGLSAMTPNRRQALKVAGLGVGALTLVACGSGTTGSASATSTSSAAGSSAGGSVGDGGTSLVALSSVPVGQAVSATLDGKPIIVAQPAAGQAVAFSAICTHMGCTVAPKGAELDCPCHGSRYNALTGEVIQGPAPKPLPKITVTINDGQVVAG